MRASCSDALGMRSTTLSTCSSGAISPSILRSALGSGSGSSAAWAGLSVVLACSKSRHVMRSSSAMSSASMIFSPAMSVSDVCFETSVASAFSPPSSS